MIEADEAMKQIIGKKSGSLNERMVTNPLIIRKERYSDAYANLTEIRSLGLSDQLISDFADMQEIYLEIQQSPDSLKESVILNNEPFLTALANDSINYCQADALNLLELLNDSLYPRSVYIGDFPEERFFEIVESRFGGSECILKLTPNPASKNVVIDLSGEELGLGYRISLLSPEGKILKQIRMVENITEYSFSLNGIVKGLYFISLEGTEGIICKEKLVVE